jgi:hypothetical protein
MFAKQQKCSEQGQLLHSETGYDRLAGRQTRSRREGATDSTVRKEFIILN